MQVLEKYGQQLNQVYNWGLKAHSLVAHVTNVMTEEEAAYYQSLYDEEVRVVLDLLYTRVKKPFEMLYI